MIKRHIGESDILSYKKAASEEFSFNDVVTVNNSGYLTKATSSTDRDKIVGLIQSEVKSTDGNYADNSVVPVENAGHGEFLADVSSGSASDSDTGKRYDLDDENSVDLSSQTYKQVQVTRVLSSDKVVVKFITSDPTLIDSPVRLASAKQTFSYDEMTDGGSASGTLELSNITIPKGAVAVRAFITDVTGFSGDTSATIKIGDGSDADRYNTGTPDVNSDADNVDAGAPSGTKFHSAEKTPKVTITSDSDFSSVNAGQATITLSWYELT